MSELETMVPQGIELLIAGEPLLVKPLKVGQLPGFLRAISPVMQQLAASQPASRPITSSTNTLVEVLAIEATS